MVLTCRISPPTLIHDTRLIVAHDGQVLWTSHVRYQLTCITWPPRQDVECQLRFGSWTLSSDLLKLQTVDRSAGAPASDFYLRNNDWQLTSTTVAAHDVEYPCCPGQKYGDVTYSFRMRRRSTGVLREVRSGSVQPASINASSTSATSRTCYYYLSLIVMSATSPSYVRVLP